MSLPELMKVSFISVVLALNWKNCSSPSPKSSSCSDRAGQYLTHIFVHSLIITGSTPLLRVIYNRWYAHTPLHWLFSDGLRAVLPSSVANLVTSSLPSSFPYPTAAESPNIDPAFFLHSFFGLLWLVVGHITVKYAPSMTRKAHRRMGKVAFASFAMHMAVCVYTLFVDVARHHPLSRIMLLLNPVMSWRFFLGAIAAAKRGDIKEHRQLMLRVYLYSTEGAGTIRQVEHFMWMLGLSPGLCQRSNQSFATTCVTPYALRLIFTRLLTLYHLACIARRSYDKDLMTNVVEETQAFVIQAGTLLGAMYILGLDAVAHFLQSGGYCLFLIAEMFLPKAGAPKLKGFHEYVISNYQ